MMLTTIAPPATGRPRVPLAPVLSRASFVSGGLPQPPSVLDAGAVRLVTSGRIAIALALREMGIRAGDSVLVPAYHSMSMVAPVLACGARPQFYKVGADAAIDLADVASKLDASVKAIMVTSYFGFPQPLAAVRAFCDRHGIALLEDCAHAFFGRHGGRSLGSWGDYAIASSMKFFPIYEGGALVSARHALTTPAPHSAGLGFEAKAALNALENSFSWRRLPLVHAALWLPLRVKALVWRLVKRGGAPALTPSSSDSSYEFDPRWLDKRSSFFSRQVLGHASHGRIVVRRRANYTELANALGSLPGCRPLHAQLPEGTCPWLFPLLVDDPEPLVQRLLAAGVPMTRFAETLWPGVDASVCANSVHLSRHVLGFPCHQELQPDEMAWLIDAIDKAVCT
ncbi:DegT/DnrJ/EryC1/StrS family aminotransferase [Massilia sp. CF038]|uniref:DegT/DnrJ/EryC1/StrS family aminotransferase n=1 Tax=Massilia sp. CF038 TaxID=1881045 RepID=UPI000922F3E4|nr:DegT/DnrJ/EryC1/StrS family aminotransferase [Massilia sp. CF038]SHH41763.1 dTDP-4-amino-4,6-dideoxygalactose transaminase [Massilia sp. CF038]